MKQTLRGNRFSTALQTPPGIFLRSLLRFGNFLSSQSEIRVIAMTILLLAILAEVDILTGEVSTSIFYLIPIAITTWRFGRTAGVMMSFVSATIWGVIETNYGFSYSHLAIPLWNAIVRLGFFLIVTHALSALAIMQEWIRTDFLT